MKRMCILGVGSPLGADSVGWEAAEALRGSALGAAYPNIEVTVETCDRPGAGLLARMQGVDLAILIDAVLGSGDCTGSVYRLDPSVILEQVDGLSSHSFGVAEALALGAAMGELPPHLAVFGIDIGDGNEPVEFEYGALAEGIREVIARHIDGHAP
jgi:hydrogenase maturation protease